jgi:hypothetical protein
MTVEVDIREIKELLGQLNRKLDAFVEGREIQSLMTVSQRSLNDFLMEEPDLYSASDLRVVYK